MSKHPHISSRSRANDGFALVVVAALFIAFAIVAAVLVERNTALQFITRRDAAQQQLSRLANAIIEYSVVNANSGTLLYPCPAREDLLTSNAAFGTDTSPCSDSSTDSGGKTSGLIPVMGGNVLRGMVPVQALAPYGIGLNDAFDPWNNRIEYVVNRKLAKGSTSTALVEQLNNPSIVFPNTPTAPFQPRPDFILISYGKDGLGGIKRDATSAAISCPGAASLRQNNCSVTTSFKAPPTYVGGSAAAGTYFDDVLTWFAQ